MGDMRTNSAPTLERILNKALFQVEAANARPEWFTTIFQSCMVEEPRGKTTCRPSFVA